ncbi:MAG: hypothetical protein H7829_17830 [Magnetococcus sp. THC-1_WYH]
MTTPKEAEEIEAALHESLQQIGQGDASPTFEDADALFQYLAGDLERRNGPKRTGTVTSSLKEVTGVSRRF